MTILFLRIRKPCTCLVGRRTSIHERGSRGSEHLDENIITKPRASTILWVGAVRLHYHKIHTRRNGHWQVCLTAAAAAVMVIDQSHPLLHNFLKWHLLAHSPLMRMTPTRRPIVWKCCGCGLFGLQYRKYQAPDTDSFRGLLEEPWTVAMELRTTKTTNAAIFSRFHLSLADIVSAHTITHERVATALETDDSEIINTRPTCCNWLVSQKSARDDRCRSRYFYEHGPASHTIDRWMGGWLDGWLVGLQRKNLFAEKHKSRLIR